MIRFLVFFVVSSAALSACLLDVAGLGGPDQTRGSPPGKSEGGGGAAVDANGAGGTGASAEQAASSSATGGSATEAPLCDVTRKDLVACYTFDDELLDGSSYANNAKAASMSYVPGQHGSAIKVNAASKIQVPDSQSWDFTSATIEMWIKPSSIPPGNYGESSPRAGLMDKDGQFGLFLYPGGRLLCGFAGDATGGAVAKDVWTHVACTGDGATVTLYVNGVFVGSHSSGKITHTGAFIAIGGDSPSLGDPFDGVIDDLRVFNVVRSKAEICEAARPNCQ